MSKDVFFIRNRTISQVFDAACQALKENTPLQTGRLETGSKSWNPMVRMAALAAKVWLNTSVEITTTDEFDRAQGTLDTRGRWGGDTFYHSHVVLRAVGKDVECTRTSSGVMSPIVWLTNLEAAISRHLDDGPREVGK